MKLPIGTIQQALAPQSVTGAASPNVIDTQGYDFLDLLFEVGTGPATTAMTALKLQESDIKASGTTLTGGTDVPGTIFGTSNTLALPTNVVAGQTPGGAYQAATGVYPETQQFPLSALPAANNTVFLIRVDLKGRKRYLLPVIATGAAQATLMACIAILSAAEIAPHVPSQMVPSGGGVLQSPPFCPNTNGL
jgi:hypothetical protein